MEMIKQQVLVHEAAECVHHGADDCIFRILHIAPQPQVSREAGEGVFQHVQPADDVHEHVRREQKGNPEGRISKNIEGHSADKIGSEIKRPVPEDTSRFDRVIRVHGKRDLLHIEVAGDRKQSAVADQRPHNAEERCRKVNQKCGNGIIHFSLFLLLDFWSFFFPGCRYGKFS